MLARTQHTPGSFVLDFGHLGVRPTLSLLGQGVLRFDRAGDPEAQDSAVAAYYSDLSMSWDPVGDLRQAWTQFGETHRWARRVMDPLTAAFDGCSDVQEQKLSQVAASLSKVSLHALCANTGGDPLGGVYSELIAQLNRRREPHTYYPIGAQAIDVLTDAMLHGQIPRGTFTDLWCGSGIRAIGVSAAQRMLGHNPHATKWFLSDPSATATALCAVNCVWYDLGPQIRISVNQEQAEKWLALKAAGRVPSQGLTDQDITVLNQQ